MGGRHRHGGPCPGDLAGEALLRRPDGVRRRPQRSCQPRRCRHARHAAGDQPRMRCAGGPHRPRPQGEDQPQQPSSTARTTSIPTCRRAIRSRNTRSRSSARARWSVDLADGETVTIGIERLHLEQDAGKSLHDQHATMSFVDLNRAGVALMEIVSRPDLRSSEEARAFLTKLRTILRYLGTSDADMEKGNLRADVNVSVRRPGEPLGTRCEIKNVNSIRFVGQAIEHEARRQIAHHRGRRHDRAGDAALRPGQGRDALHAHQGGGARLPLFPRPRSPAARARPGLGR